MNIKNEIDKYFNNIFITEQKQLILSNIQIDINYILNIFNVTNINFKKYLINKRNEIRNLIKNNNYTLDDLNYLIKYNYKNINDINICLTSLNNNIIKIEIEKLYNNNINLFLSFIVTDIYVLNFLEKIILDISLTKTKIINFIYNIKLLLLYDNNKYDEFFNKLSYVFIKYIYNNNNNVNNIIPNNIQNIINFNNNLKYLLEINNFYCDIKFYINKNSSPIIYKQFIELIDNNNIYDILIIFNELWDIIYKLYNNNNYNSKIINILIIKLKNINNTIDYIHMFDIIIKCYNIFNNKNLSLLNITLNELFDSNNILLFDIMNYYYNISYNTDLKYNKLLYILLNINNIDSILFIHYKLLIDKLINNYNLKINYCESIKIEKDIYNIFIINKTLKKSIFTKNIIKFINDIELSYKINTNFLIKNYYNNINIIINSYDISIINYNEGYLTSNLLTNNNFLDKILVTYNTNFLLFNNNSKQLIWYLHYGEINITYNTKNIKMLPIHFYILELFNDTNKILLNDINNLTIFLNYSLILKNKIIQSLINSNLLFINDKYLELNQNTNFDIDIIDIYLNMTNYKNNKIDIYELILSREDIIKTNINHQLKIKSLSYDNLYNILTYSIKAFKIDKDIYDISLNYLIKMDYIIKNNNMLIKCS